MTPTPTRSTDRTDTITEYVEGESSGYTVRAQLLDPSEDPSLEKQGHRSPAVLFTVFAGAEVFSHHDRFKLIRQMPGDNQWLHDHLERMADRLLTDPTDVAPEEAENYIIAVDDTFRVPADEVDTAEDAERVASEQFGHDNWKVFEPSVVDVELGAD